MPPIKSKTKARSFIDAVDTSLTMRRTRDAEGELSIEVAITEPTDDLVAIVQEADKQGLIVRFDGMRILIEEPPEAPLPVEVTPEEPPDVPSTTRPLRPGEEPPP